MFGVAMPRHAVSRALSSVFSILGLLVAVFVITRLTGDPTLQMVAVGSTQEQIDALRHSMGLDQPIYVQLLRYFAGVVRGDLGMSLWQKQPALRLVLERLPATLQLTVAALLISTVVSIPAGIVSAIRRNALMDRVLMSVAVLGQSIPVFWLGIMLIWLFGLWLKVLPIGGSGGIRHLVLPAVTLGMYTMARLARIVRSSMLEVLTQDYLRTARSKGLMERTVLLRHALKNAAIPVVTMYSLELSALIGGAVITETIFGWPGIGRLLVQAIYERDFPLVQAAVLVICILVVAISLMTDLSYGVIDPRSRRG